MMWLLFLGFAIIAWGAYDIFFKVLGSSMNYFLALFIIGLLQAVIALPFIIYSYYTEGLSYTNKGFYISALMGVLLGAGTIFFFYTFKSGAPLSVAMSAYGVGSILIGALAGVLFFKEALTPMILAGMVFGAISIILMTAK